MSRDAKQPDTHRMVSARPVSASHLARWKYADPTGRIVYRDAPDPALRLIRAPESEESKSVPSSPAKIEQE